MFSRPQAGQGGLSVMRATELFLVSIRRLPYFSKQRSLPQSRRAIRGFEKSSAFRLTIPVVVTGHAPYARLINPSPSRLGDEDF